MDDVLHAPYGSWRSPISPALVAAGQIELSEPTPAGDATYWLETRPEEDGRTALMRHTPAAGPAEVTPPGFDCRSRVHEYGGGAYVVVDDAVVYLSRFDDQRLWRLAPGESPRPVTPAPRETAALRYADACPTRDGRSLICVRESHERTNVVNRLVAVPADGAAAPITVESGHDFYAFPRVSPDGRWLAWIAWDHPRLPWDGTELWVGRLDRDSTLRGSRRVAGGPEESIFQPEWSADGVLHFVSDRTGWWNLYREREGRIEPLAPMEAEAGEPQWQFRQSTYAFLPDGRIACVTRRGADQRLVLIARDSGRVEPLDIPYTSFDVPYLRSHGHRVTFIAGSPQEAPAVVSLDVRTGAAQRLRSSLESEIRRGCISVPSALEFPTGAGETAHALLYPPANDAFAAPPGELPPAIVISHGGPTGQTSTALDLRVQLWTSRGFAVIDVDYRGSTGYGRAYRERLRGEWGIADVEDCVNAARHLGHVVDLDRLVIRGASAGGYTTLCALTFHDVFRAGASWFGVADLEALTRDTHKFESHYLDGLIGPYPEVADRYRARSPIHAVERLRRPMILFQGLLDEVVPRPGRADGPVARDRRHPVRIRAVRERVPRIPPGRERAARARGRAELLQPGLRLRGRRAARAREHRGLLSQGHAKVSQKAAGYGRAATPVGSPKTPSSRPSCSSSVRLSSPPSGARSATRHAAPGRTLLFCGEPGIGKSALLSRAAATADALVLTTRGAETESELPFAGLRDLLAPLLEAAPELPQPQRAALLGALAIEEVDQVELFGVFTGALTLMSIAAERRPLLICADDLQWLDAGSADTLRFVAGRIGGEPITMLLAARERPTGLDGPEIDMHALRGLSRQGAQALLAGQMESTAPLELVDELHRATGGNPLALVELSRGEVDLTRRVAAGLAPLPVCEAIRTSFARRPECPQLAGAHGARHRRHVPAR